MSKSPSLGKTREKVAERDRGLCQICFAQGMEIHHIVHRSQIKEPELRDSERNLICLCLKCHAHVHRHGIVGGLMKIMTERYHYDYSEWPFKRWLDDK